jgi:S1-C subfamily serine protease
MSTILTALLLVSSVPVVEKPLGSPFEPTFNLSAVRLIDCEEGSGSGFLIGNDILVTADHVATLTNCVDAQTKVPLKAYKRDIPNDTALMTGKLPNMPYFKYNCSRYKKGQTYSAYGISAFFQDNYIFRSVSMKGTGDYTDVSFLDGSVMPNMPRLWGFTVPGMSGGPIVDIVTGFVVGIVNAGMRNVIGIPTGEAFSYELAETFLCKNGQTIQQGYTPRQTSPQTSPKIEHKSS